MFGYVDLIVLRIEARPDQSITLDRRIRVKLHTAWDGSIGACRNLVALASVTEAQAVVRTNHSLAVALPHTQRNTTMRAYVPRHDQLFAYPINHKRLVEKHRFDRLNAHCD